MKKIFIIGFEPYTEKMYPMLFDFLREMKRYYEVVYYGGDDRGVARRAASNLITGQVRSREELRNVFLSIYHYFRRRKILKRLFSHHNDVDVVIAIDQQAYNHAVKFTSDTTLKVLWVHDFISPDWEEQDRCLIKAMLKEHRGFLAKCDLILIQDRSRAAVFDALFMTHQIPKSYMHIFLTDYPFCRKVAVEKKSKRDFPVINVMQITPNEVRGTMGLLEAYQSLDDRVKLFFQGNMSVAITKAIATLKKKPQHFPVKETYAEMRECIQSMDIGIVIYPGELHVNTFFVNRASGQMTEFLRLGIPVITVGHNDMEDFVYRYGFGEHIYDTRNLGQAIDRIIKRYKECSTCARKTFEDLFSAEQQVRGASNDIQRCFERRYSQIEQS